MNNEGKTLDAAERKKLEVLALSGIRGSQVMDVILGHLDTQLAGVSSVPLNETNWDVKRAHADGYAAALGDHKQWLIGRSTSVIDHETGRVLSAKLQNSLSERKRRNEK